MANVTALEAKQSLQRDQQLGVAAKAAGQDKLEALQEQAYSCPQCWQAKSAAFQIQPCSASFLC
jgi:hypothetical protein